MKDETLIRIDNQTGSVKVRTKIVNDDGTVDYKKEYRPDDDMTAESNEMLKDAVALTKKWKIEGKLKAKNQVESL